MTLLSGVYNFFRQRGSCHPQHVVQPDSPRTDENESFSYFSSSDDLSSSSRTRSPSSSSSDEDTNAFVIVIPQNHPTVIENKTEKKGFFKRIKDYFFSFRPRMRLPSLRRKSSAPQEKPVSSNIGDVRAIALELDRVSRVKEKPKLPKNFEDNGF